MTTKQSLSAALLGQVTEAGAVADLLWHQAGPDVASAKAAPSTPDQAVRLAKEGGLDVALKVASVLTDPVALDALVRSDDRKRVRRAVAANPNVSSETVSYLLAWALKPKVQDGELVKALLGHTTSVTWPQLRDLLRGGGSLPEGVTWYPVAQLVRRTEDVSVYRDAFSQGWPGLVELLVDDVDRGAVEGMDLTEALEHFEVPQQILLLSSLLEKGHRSMGLQTASNLVRLLPEWKHFPMHTFRSGRGSMNGHRQRLSEEVARLLATSEDPRMDEILASLPGVPEDIRLDLVKRGQVHLMAFHDDLTEAVVDAIVDASSPEQALDPLGRHSGSPAAQLVGRKLSPRLADKLVEHFTRGSAGVDLGRLLVTAENAETDLRLELLRKRGSWSFTQRFLEGKAGAPRPGEVAALLANPGRALAHYPSSAHSYGPRTEVVPTAREEVLQHVEANIGVFLDKPFTDEVLDSYSGLLASTAASRSQVVSYTWRRLEDVRDDPGMLEAFLTLAPEWGGTVPELVETVRAACQVQPGA